MKKRAGVRYIVKQSVIGAEEGAEVRTFRLHRKAEKIIEESGIPYTFLRPNEFMQNFINFHVHSIKNNNAFHLPLENAKVSVVDVTQTIPSLRKSLRRKTIYQNCMHAIEMVIGTLFTGIRKSISLSLAIPVGTTVHREVTIQLSIPVAGVGGWGHSLIDLFQLRGTEITLQILFASTSKNVE